MATNERMKTELKKNLLADVRSLRRLQGRVERWKMHDVEIDGLLEDIRVHRIRDNSTCT